MYATTILQYLAREVNLVGFDGARGVEVKLLLARQAALVGAGTVVDDLMFAAADSVRFLRYSRLISRAFHRSDVVLSGLSM